MYQIRNAFRLLVSHGDVELSVVTSKTLFSGNICLIADIADTIKHLVGVFWDCAVFPLNSFVEVRDIDSKVGIRSFQTCLKVCRIS